MGQHVVALSELDPELARRQIAYLAKEQQDWPLRLANAFLESKRTETGRENTIKNLAFYNRTNWYQPGSNT